MTWVRIDDGAPLHPKLLDAGAEAAWLWTCGLAYCNRNHTDGLIAARHLAALYPGAWPTQHLEGLAARLVSVRLWDADGPDYRVHDYAHYQEEATREVVDARRVYERERKRAQRLKGRPGQSPGHVPDNVPGTIAGHVPGTNTGTPPGADDGTDLEDSRAILTSGPSHAPVVPPPRPVPSRPVPGSEIQNSDLVASGEAPSTTRVESRAEKAERKAAEKKAASDAAGARRARRDEERKADRAAAVQREADRKASREAKVEARRLADERKTAEKAERARLAAEAEAKRAPLPFKPIDALGAIASKADGRFAHTEARDLTTGHVIALTSSIRAYPTIEEWECLGAWLASPDCTYPGRLGVAWAASAALRDGMARARMWSAQGNLLAAPRAPQPDRFGRVPLVPVHPAVVKRGDLAVDRPAMKPGPEAHAFAVKLRDDLRAGRVTVDREGNVHPVAQGVANG